MFSYDSGFSILIRKLWTLVALSCLWLLCCLPVVTIGASTVSLVYAVRKNLLEEEGYAARNFLGCFRQEFWGATKIWLIFLGASLFLAWDAWIFFQMLLRNDPEGILLVVIGLMLLAAVVWCVHCLYYLATFEDNTKMVLKNAGRIALVHPVVNLEILIFTLLFAICLIFLPYFLLILPAVAVWLTGKSMGRIYGRLAQVPELEEEP